MNYNSEIHTNLYSDEACNIINSLILYLARRSRRDKLHTDVKNIFVMKAANNEVVLKINNQSNKTTNYLDEYSYRRSSWYSMTEPEARLYVANLLKRACHYVYKFRNDCFEWSRTNENKINIEYGFNKQQECSIKSIYYIYDVLKNRNNLQKKYDSEFITAITGIEADAIQTELETTRRDEIAKFERERSTEIANIRKKYEAIRAQSYTDQDNEIKHIEQLYKDKIVNLNNEFMILATA